MLDFSPYIDLALVWAILIGVAVFLYILLDGFGLGCGLLFPFAPSDSCRNRIMNSIAPFWDANETWLILGAGGLLEAFPVAFGILMPALYLPVILLVVGLIFRGVAFEFRFKSSDKERWLWDCAFHGGSLIATLMQGIILGSFVTGFQVQDGKFSGGPVDWASGFSLLNALTFLFGYALLGATWLVMKTDGPTQVWARQAARYTIIYLGFCVLAIAASMPYVNPTLLDLWKSGPRHFAMPLLAILGILVLTLLWRALRNTKRDALPFFLSIGLFFLGFLCFGLSFFPWVVPYQLTIWEAAAAPSSLSLVLVGVLVFLPVVLAYTTYSYYLFRGKSSDESSY